MRAAVLKKTGNIRNLKENLPVEETPVPEINDDEVLINVKSASVNHRDVWITKGFYSKIELPVIPGSDCAGIIHSAGKNVKEFKDGDEVTVNPAMNWGESDDFQGSDFKILGMPDNGTFAEYVKVNKSQVFLKPSHLSMEEASALPLTGITAYNALFKKAKCTAGDTVLITGIGGGVATSALVFAVSAGAKVYVTSGSDEKINKAVSLGAAGGVNYNKEGWDKELEELSDKKISIAIDGTGSDIFLKCIEIVRYGGRIVSYGATKGNPNFFPMARLFWKQLKIYGTTMGTPEDFTGMIKYVNEKKVVPVIDQIFSLENISDALRRMSNGDQIGKIVVRI